jgi:hypothetical protein
VGQRIADSLQNIVELSAEAATFRTSLSPHLLRSKNSPRDAGLGEQPRKLELRSNRFVSFTRGEDRSTGSGAAV